MNVPPFESLRPAIGSRTVGSVRHVMHVMHVMRQALSRVFVRRRRFWTLPTVHRVTCQGCATLGFRNLCPSLPFSGLLCNSVSCTKLSLWLCE